MGAEIEHARLNGKLERIEPRCKICRQEPVRKLVNKLLAMGLSRPGILNALDLVNDGLSPDEQITYDNIYTHQKRHFDPSQPAREVYDAIVRKRAHDDPAGAEAVGAQVNAMSYLETMMIKGFATLTDEGTTVSAEEGAKAAVKLHELTRSEAGTQQAAEILVRQSRIIAAMQELIPEDKIPLLLARVEGLATPTIDGEIVTEDDGSVVRGVVDPDDIGDDDDDEDDYY